MKAVPILIILSLTAMIACQSADPIPAQIAQVENGLLPSVLLKGEPAWTLSERMAHHRVPGLSIAVIENFEVVWVRHYGVANSETGAPVTDSTLFGVGSCSKAVAAAAALCLAGEGKLSLDADINSQLRSWQLPENDFTRSTPVTLRHLLNHSGGVQTSPGLGYDPEDVPTLIQILSGEPPAKNGPANVTVTPGTVFQYSNLGFSISQQAMIDADRAPYPDIVKRTVLAPLGMVNSTVEQPLPDSLFPHLATGHRSDGSPLAGPQLAYPDMAAAGLFTTAADYAKFIIELQLSYHGRSNKILSAAMADTMLSPGYVPQYGLGTFMRGDDYFGHFGDLRGFFAGYIGHRTNGSGAVLVSNSANGIALEREVIRSIARACGWEDILPEVLEVVTLPDDLLDKYDGRYRLGSDDVLTISHDDTAVYGQTTGGGSTRLYPIATDVLVAKETRGELTMLVDSTGEVTGAVHHFADNLGRLADTAPVSERMADDVMVPLEMIQAGDPVAAAKGIPGNQGGFA